MLLRAIKQSDHATIPLAIRVSVGAHRQKNGERCAAMQERIIFSAIMRQRKQLNWLMILLLVAFSGSFLILVEEVFDSGGLVNLPQPYSYWLLKASNARSIPWSVFNRRQQLLLAQYERIMNLMIQIRKQSINT